MPGTQQPARLLAESRGTESKNLLHGTALVFLWHRIHRRTREESKFSQLPLFLFRTAESTRCSPALLTQSDGSRFLEIRSMLRKQERVAVCCSAGRVRLVGSRHSNMVRIAEEPIDRVSRAPAWEARRLDKRTLPLRQGRVSSVAPS
jgi:hypothetical protein